MTNPADIGQGGRPSNRAESTAAGTRGDGGGTGRGAPGLRPAVLNPLFRAVETLPGIGPKVAKGVEEIAGPLVVDLCWHLPSGLIDRRYQPRIAEAEIGRVATLEVEILDHQPSPSPRRPYRVRCGDGTGFLDLVFFHARGDFLERQFPVGERRLVSGRIDRYQGRLQMAHPDEVVELRDRVRLTRVEPVYPGGQAVAQRTLRKAIDAALSGVPELPEWLMASLLQHRRWPAWKPALLAAHAPESEAALEGGSLPRQRLAYDELLADQLALLLIRARRRWRPGRAVLGDGHLRRKLRDELPFRLTAGQEQALAEILDDMASERRMMRLVQGDVGAGKTVVAALAMLAAVEAGAQAALMAPTEILARQHHARLGALAARIGLKVELLTGRDKTKARGEALTRIASGQSSLVVGTHALFQEGVEFRDLALAVIDEQHRFGVHERLQLGKKGERVDILVMTATPIPRTLLMTAYGDVDVSRILEKPAGRQPIDTRAVPLDRLHEVVEAVGRALEAGRKVYWVCPLVEESEVVGLAAAEERHATLKQRFGERVGLVHGRLAGAEKDRVMQAFAEGGVDLLVATTVIEVGVDVPTATVMVIEQAERFGLAQLHQLRGRIGRGSERSTCLLLYQGPLGEAARRRLEVLRESNDGFMIAEEDLRLRGGGEILGTKQSGLPRFRLADLEAQAEMLEVARDDARLVLEQDPALESERGQALRTLLYLFRRDEAVRFLESG